MNRDRTSPEMDDVSTGKSDKDKTMVPLHDDFTPGDNDVICGRGKKCYAHVGNERFRRIVAAKLARYSAASSRPEKSEILSSIVTEVRLSSPNGGFVKQDTKTGKWFEVGDFLAREKTSQAFRDALHEDYRSSKKSKHEKRRQRSKAKAMMDKRSQSASPGASSIGYDEPMLYAPALNSSPLVSRQHLTVLREEHPPQHLPGSHSYAGPVREPLGRSSRAMSLGRGRDNITLDDRGSYSFAESPYLNRPAYHHDHERSISGEELAAYHHEERLNPRHESWHGPFPGERVEMFNAPPSFHASAPQFHTTGAGHIAAHRTYPIQSSGVAMVDEMGAPFGEPQWSYSDRDSGMPPIHPSNSRRGSSFRGYEAPVPAYSEEAPRHRRNDSTDVGVHRRNDSTMSATGIMAHLTSAIPADSLKPDDSNPFEPLPIGGRPRK